MSSRIRFASLFIAIFALAFLVACGGGGSNTSSTPPSGGFSTSDFNGTYTFSVTGSDENSSGSLGALTIAGTITAGGNGTLSAGNVDITDTSGAGPNIAINTSASGYTVDTDGTGKLTLVVPTTSSGNVPFIFAFALTDAAHGVISEYDTNGTGSGTIDLQPSPVTLATTPYAFSLSGSDLSLNLLSAVGTFTLSSSGTITAGIEDYNHAGAPSTGLGLTGGVAVGTGTAPGTATLDTSFGNLTFDVYAIDATHLKLIESDGQAVLAGDAYTGSSTMPSGTLAFTVTGLDASDEPFAAGGFVSSDGASNLSNGAEDINDDGEVDGGTTTSYAFSGSFVASPSGSGRFAIALSGFQGGTNFAAYPSSGGVLMLETDNSTLYEPTTAGVAMAQSSGATGLAASQGWIMNLTGSDITNDTELDQIAQFDTTSSNLTSGTIFLNDYGVANPSNYGVSSSSTYAAGGSSSSTGQATLNFNGGSEEALYYAVSDSASLALSVDTSDVSVGSFQLQGSPSSTSDVAQRHLAMLKATLRPHAAKKKKQS
jgi:hypothetical protein